MKQAKEMQDMSPQVTEKSSPGHLVIRFGLALWSLLALITSAQAGTQMLNIDVTVLDPGCEITVDNASPALQVINSSVLGGSAVQHLGSFNLKLENCVGKLAAAKNLNLAVSGTTVKDDKVFRGASSTSAGVGFVLFWNAASSGLYANALKTTDAALNWPGSTGADLTTLNGKLLPIAVGGVAYASPLKGGTLTGAVSFAISVK
ncbi:type 1 fimbrial protein [Salmonella enterica]|nr:type 1 fimbrial protein [Salmonella enterica]